MLSVGNMKRSSFITALLGLLCVPALGKRKQRISAETFTAWSYSQDPFTADMASPDEATITSPYSDGVSAPLPFRIIRGELTEHEFRETLIFITDNLSEAYNH